MKKKLWIAVSVVASISLAMFLILSNISHRYQAEVENNSTTQKNLSKTPLINNLEDKNTVDSIWGKQPIKVALYEYGYFYFEGKGIDKDIIDELQKRSGCTFKTEVMSRARIWTDLASGELDMSVSGIWNKERDNFAWFANYLIMKNYALIHKQKDKAINNLTDFTSNRELIFGVVSSFKHGEAQDLFLAKLRKEKRVQESVTVDALFNKLKNHRINGMFSQIPVYTKYLKENYLTEEISIQDWTKEEKGVLHGLILSKNRFTTEEFLRWQKIVDEMKNDGTLKKIYLKYLSAEDADKLLEF